MTLSFEISSLTRILRCCDKATNTPFALPGVLTFDPRIHIYRPGVNYCYGFTDVLRCQASCQDHRNLGDSHDLCGDRPIMSQACSSYPVCRWISGVQNKIVD